MSIRLNRRRWMQAGGAAALVPGVRAAAVKWPPAEGSATPKICVGSRRDADGDAMRQWIQVGIRNVLMGGPPIPWQEADLRAIIDPYKAAGISVCNLMIGGFNDVIYGRSGRDRQIEEVIASIRAAGRVGLPVIEYNFYANRLMEGYKEEIGRGGAGYTAYDYRLSKQLGPKEGVGTHTRAEQLKRAKYFLEAVVPEAKKANVRLALHPNDPPVPLSRGSEQLMATFAHWKEYLDLVRSPYNGMTFDCGVTREMGEDPVVVCRHLGSAIASITCISEM